MKKRLLAVLLAVVMTAALLPVTALADSQRTVLGSGNCLHPTWTLYSDGEMVIAGTGKMAGYYVDSYGKINTPWAKLRDSIKTVTIQEGVTGVGAYAFYGCTNLTKVTFPEGLTEIDYNAFEGCVALASMTLPENLKNLGYHAFKDCASLTGEIAIPGQIWSLQGTFQGCTGVTGFSVSPDSESLAVVDGVVFNKSKTTVQAYPSGRTGAYTIPDGVTSISSYAFAGCVGLSDIIIPGGVTSIRSYAFTGCDGLTDMVIPEGVTGIEQYAFSDCAGLTSVVIPTSMARMEWGVFVNCENLSHVTILSDCGVEWHPVSDEIGMFRGCGRLKTAGPVGGGYNIEFNWTESIPMLAFANCPELSDVTIPDSMTTIGRYAFYGCTAMSGITIPGNVTVIEADAFEECYGLSDVTIPDSVTTIEAGAFGNCINLTHIEIPNSVTTIESRAFWGCKRLPSIAIPESVTTIERQTFSNCIYLTDVTIPDSVTTIGDFAFFGCKSLPGITIPAGVTSIGEGAFRDCKNLTRITVPDGVTAIEGQVFSGCISLTRFIIPDGVTSIGGNAFNGCTNLRQLYVPASVTSIGDNAFSKWLCAEELVVYGAAGSEAERHCGYHTPFVAGFPPATDRAGTLESDDGKSVSWDITEEGLVTVDTTNLAPEEAVLVGCYDMDGSFAGVRLLDARSAKVRNAAVQLDPATPNVKLFWLGANQNPLSPSATVWGK